MVKISIIIPVFNVEEYLRECLDSVVNQSFKDVEIICINDGSTDNSLNILNEYASKDDRFKIISQKNFGQGHARKVGLDEAIGDYVLFLDSDDFLELNTFELLYDNILSNNSDVVLFKLIRYNHFTGDKLYNAPAFDIDAMLDEDFNNFTFSYLDVKPHVMNRSFSPVCKFYKLDFLRKYDDFFFDSNIRYEDVPFHIQVMLRAKISFCPFFLYNYRISNMASSINSATDEKVMDIFKIIDVVEILLKEEGFFECFEREFNKFKFDQILNYILPSKSNTYFRESKNRLVDLNVNFSYHLFNKIQYDCVLKSSNFDDFINNVIVELKNKLFSLNNEINKQSRIMNSKDVKISDMGRLIESKDVEISDMGRLIESKDVEIKKLSQELKKSTNENKYLKNQLSEVFSSNSWRKTEFLRKIGRLFH